MVRADRNLASVVFLVTALAAVTVSASTFGHLELTVVGPDGAAMAGCEVVLTSPVLLVARTGDTDAHGRLLLKALPPASYRARVVRPGFEAATVDVEVTQNATRRRTVRLALAPLRATLEVTAAAPLVDPTRTGTATHVTREEVDRLPVGRDYRAYPQLAPGVTVTPNSGGLQTRYEPASKAGNFYHDRGAGLGSRDNLYYLDGFDITDFAGGIGSLTFTNQAIQEQEVTTSGLSPQYSGGAGYVAAIVTRSGGPELEGSFSLFLQQPWMYSAQRSADDRLRIVEEDRFDVGASLGGPLVADRLRFFASVQRRGTANGVELSASAAPEPTATTYRLTRDNGFLKLTWGPDDAQRVTASVLADDLVSSGSPSPTTPPNRFSATTSDSTTALVSTQRLIGDALVLDWRIGRFAQVFKGVPEHPEEGPSNTLLFEPEATAPAWMRLQGSSGDGGRTTHRKLQGDLVATWFAEAGGSHEVRGGLQYARWEEETATEATFGAALTSLAPHLAGMSFAEARALNLLPPSEYDWIFRTLAGDPASAAFAAADADADGVLTAAEFADLSFASRADNPHGVNFLRERLVQDGVNNVQELRWAAFLEDRWVLDRWTLWSGVRVEDLRYVASDGTAIGRMEPALYPRLALAWDPRGEGRQRLSLAWGRYPDVLRSPMIRFAGSLSGAVRADEVFIGDDWYAYRTRGSAVLDREAGFAPNLANELEEELQLTWEAQLGDHLRLLVEGYQRRDRNLIEDYDPRVYLDPAVAGDLVLTPGDFGYPPSGPTGVSYFLGNLVGGTRRTRGVDVTLARRWAGGWDAALQYSFKDARGNSNSNGAADLQGDFLDLDPRRPYMWGPLPGTVAHQAKLYGSWITPWRLQIGGLAYWNGGAAFTEADIFRPGSYDIYSNHRRGDGSYVRMGQERHPDYLTVDLRFRYPVVLGPAGELTLWADVLNALDNQDPIRLEEAHNHPEFTTYREPRLLLEPRRLQLGATFTW